MGNRVGTPGNRGGTRVGTDQQTHEKERTPHAPEGALHQRTLHDGTRLWLDSFWPPAPAGSMVIARRAGRNAYPRRRRRNAQLPRPRSNIDEGSGTAVMSRSWIAE